LKPIVILSACLTLALSTVTAEAKLKGCFQRIYDKQHLKQHKGQMVRAMQFQIGIADEKVARGQEDDESDQDTLAVRFVGKKGDYYGGNFQCRGSGEEAECLISDQQTKITIVQTAKGIRLSLGGPTTVQLEAEEAQMTIPADIENQTYALAKIRDSNCIVGDW
jgi:hypothetical protein